MIEGMDYDGLINELVKQGRKVGKTPWCCDGYSEGMAFDILNGEGDFPQETMLETRKRWMEEGKITKEEYRDDIKWVKETHEDEILATTQDSFNSLKKEGLLSKFLESNNLKEKK